MKYLKLGVGKLKKRILEIVIIKKAKREFNIKNLNV